MKRIVQVNPVGNVEKQFTFDDSVSEPVYRSTQGCRQEWLGLRPNVEFEAFYWCLYKVQQIVKGADKFSLVI